MAANNSLKHDLNSIQSAVTSLLGKVISSPTVPSWRFPEKMAVDVKLEGLVAREEEGSRLLMTELIVDRLLLLLQLAVKLIDTRGCHHQSAVVPLTLGSAVRKFTKCVLAQQRKEDKEEVSSMKQLHSSAKSGCCHDVSVQTIETALAVCPHCDECLQALIEINNRLNPSTKQPVTTSKILGSILDSLNTMEADHESTQQQCHTHLTRIAEQDSDLEELRTECHTLHSNITALEHELNLMEERFELAIIERDNDHSKEMERAMSALQAEREAAVSLRKDVSRARVEADQAKQEQQKKCMEQIMAERKNMEAQLRAVQVQLEEELACQRDTNQQLIENRNIQLNKAKLLSCSLDKRCKYLQAKQASLLLHVDQLDEQCNQLQHDLSSALADKEDLIRDLAVMKAQLQQHHNTHKVLLEEAESKHSELTLHSCNLEQQLKLARSQLEEERAKRRLMIDCPMLSDVGQLASQQSAQQYVSANIIRIHSLEEQNGELRKWLIPSATHDEQHYQVLEQPVRLWQDHQRPSSSRTRSYRGRLGHLVDALNHSQQQQEAWHSQKQQQEAWHSQKQQQEAWTSDKHHELWSICSICDRMLCSDHETIL